MQQEHSHIPLSQTPPPCKHPGKSLQKHSGSNRCRIDRNSHAKEQEPVILRPMPSGKQPIAPVIQQVRQQIAPIAPGRSETEDLCRFPSDFQVIQGRENQKNNDRNPKVPELPGCRLIDALICGYYRCGAQREGCRGSPQYPQRVGVLRSNRRINAPSR